MKKRNVVLTLLCGVSAITFLDRLALPIAAPGIRADLHLSPQQWGWVLSSYILANALFEIPSGAMGDRHGQRRELTRIAAWWSAFTAATAWCRNFFQIASARFLFGVGAAGAYPNAAAVVSRWFPRSEHARAQGFIWASGRLGGALALLLLVPVEHAYGWRSIFWGMGILGLIWATLWWLFYRNNPENTPGITTEELAELGSPTVTSANFDPLTLPHSDAIIPWKALLGLKHLWILTAAYFCYAWGSWFFFGWFTTWLMRGAGFSFQQMGLFAALPFLMGIAGNLIGGSVSQRLVLRRGRRQAYRWVAFLCLLVASALLLAMTRTHSHAAIIAFATAGFGIMDLMLPAAWAMSMSLGGRFGGTASAVMNTAGNLGGWVCTIAFGYAIKLTGNYNLPLRVIAAMVLLAAFLFLCTDCTQGLDDSHSLLPPSPAFQIPE